MGVKTKQKAQNKDVPIFRLLLVICNLILFYAHTRDLYSFVLLFLLHRNSPVIAKDHPLERSVKAMQSTLGLELELGAF